MGRNRVLSWFRLYVLELVYLINIINIIESSFIFIIFKIKHKLFIKINLNYSQSFRSTHTIYV